MPHTAAESFRQLVEQSPFGVYAVDADFRLALVSAGAQKVFAQVRPLIGRDFEEVLRTLWPEPFASQAVERFRHTLATGEPYHAPGTVEHRADIDETEAYDWKIERVTLPDGRPGVVCHFYDLSERQRYEEELRVARSRLEATIDAARVVLFHQDADLRYTWIHNPALGYAAADVVGKRDADLFRRPEDARRVEEVKRAVLATGQPQRQEVCVVQDGTSHYFDLAVQPDRDADGVIRGVHCAAVDVTERKHSEAALARAAEQLREADQRKDEFLATLAHELRNPLAPIRTALHIMQRSTADAGAMGRYCAMMERQVEQLVRLIDDLLDVSRITRGHIPLQKARMRLADAVRLAADTSRPHIDTNGHALLLDLCPEPLDVEGDVARLAQVFANLLNNAARYTDRGGRIRLTLEQDGRDAVVRVEDNGIGIPGAMLTRVFDMFTQVDRRQPRSQGGLGLGLHLAKRLVEMHGGTIEATSDGPGQGAAFVVRLPLVPANADPQLAPSALVAAAPAPLRVLVVDDNRDAADTAATMLALMGHTTVTAYDGEDGLRLAEQLKPDVVLLDLGMPTPDGYETCARMREQAWGKAPRIIAMTGWGQDDDRRRAQAAGFDHHMVKPAEPEALMQLLASVRRDEASSL